jgi:hypothetical protein
MSGFLNADLPSEDEEDEDFVADERDDDEAGRKPKPKPKPKKRCALPVALLAPAIRLRDLLAAPAGAPAAPGDALALRCARPDGPRRAAGAARPRRRRRGRMRAPAARRATRRSPRRRS